MPPKDPQKPDESQLALGMPPSSYHPDSDMASMMAQVIGDYPAKLGHLKGAKLIALRRESKRSEDTFTPDGAGGSFIRNDRERGITANWDAGVWMRGRWWDAMAPAQRRPWMFHLLSHLGIRPSGDALVRLGHDVEAFADEALLFGAWEEQLALFSQNLDRNARPGPKGTPIVASAVVDDAGRTSGIAPN